MLGEDLDGVLRLELADEAWVPELGCNTEVFAAAHEGVALDSLCRSRDTVRVKVLLLAAGNTNQATGNGSV